MGAAVIKPSSSQRRFASTQGIAQGGAAAVVLLAAVMTACLASLHVFDHLHSALKPPTEIAGAGGRAHHHVYLNYNINLIIVGGEEDEWNQALSFIVAEVQASVSRIGEVMRMHISTRTTSVLHDRLDLLSISRCIYLDQGVCAARQVDAADIVASEAPASRQLKALLARDATDVCSDCIDVYVVLYDSVVTPIVLTEGSSVNGDVVSLVEANVNALRIPYKGATLVPLHSPHAGNSSAYVASLLLLLRRVVASHLFLTTETDSFIGDDEHWLSDQHVLAARVERCKRMYFKATGLLTDLYRHYVRYRSVINAPADVVSKWGSLVDAAAALAPTATSAHAQSGQCEAVERLYQGVVEDIAFSPDLGLNPSAGSPEVRLELFVQYLPKSTRTIANCSLLTTPPLLRGCRSPSP